ncbi:hypothetical protein HDU98_004097 [Podochytrium sp. JEL0797]|nr:hypothetical protein HDU98_004097 [Podochytrium sp. JEL0797]
MTAMTWHRQVLHTTFVAAPIQFKTLPRQMFGQLQGHQFPPYFAISTGLGLFLTYSTNSLGPQDAMVAGVMAAATAGALANLAVVGPMAASTKALRQQFEKAGSVVPPHVIKRFGILHGISSLLNMGMVGACVANCLWVGSKWAAKN